MASNNKGIDGDDVLDVKRLEDGDVPEDFLKVTEPIAVPTGTIIDLGEDEPEKCVPNQKEPKSKVVYESDHAMALALQKQLDLEQDPPPAAPVSNVPILQLTVTVVEAKLARNYGLTRMDPYCRVRVGHSLLRTPTAASGSKEPKWNETFHVVLLPGTQSIYIEILDECTFTADAIIAHGFITLPPKFQPQKVIDDWWPLSGREGQEKEGHIHIIYSINHELTHGLYPQPQRQTKIQKYLN
ncbi:TOLLIP [Lepeophtheirus salmonis]|uniref:TOLLIP n=1 Tax=Lepeophtheirus salmonis TaxID=72036 RepID=A0A7R8CCW5_LEPSM|nr:TOLLIP [Lepeophtheirus salmonis]CAF2767651.1 TOLLIP [Lepeophtheirus salmonis]